MLGSVRVVARHALRRYAASNTRRGVESCGILAGALDEAEGAFRISTLIIPKQEGDLRHRPGAQLMASPACCAALLMWKPGAYGLEDSCEALSVCERRHGSNLSTWLVCCALAGAERGGDI